MNHADHRRHTAAPIDADLADVLAQAMAAHAAAPPVEPASPPDPAATLARQLADRAVILADGDFPAVVVDRCRMDDPGETPALRGARAYADQRERTLLVLLGGVGCGKTTAATWLARELGGRRPGFIRAEKLERRGRYDADLAAWLDARTFLVVDDLGVEYLDGKGAFTSLLDGLVADFAERRRRVVFTSNLDAGELRERLTSRIWSRICAHAVPFVHCGDVDLRRRPAVTPLRGVR